MSERLRKRIDALRVEYVKTFEEEAAAFEAELRANTRESISKRAHRIGGTAGSYQLHEVCSAAQHVERLCEAHVAENGKSQDDEVLAQAVAKLCGALREAQLLSLQAAT